MNPNNLTKMFWIAAWMLIMCHAVFAFAEGELNFKPLGLSSWRIETLFEIRQRYEDNVFQVPMDSKPQQDLVTSVWAGLDLKIRFDERTRFSTRYEAALRRLIDLERKNRRDQLLSLLFQRKLGRKLSLLMLGNLGLRSQPNDQINDYFKQNLASQVHIQWTPLWSSQFGAQLRHKSFPNNNSDYTSVMVEGKLRRRLGVISQIRGGYQLRAYNGAVDPRVLQSNLNKDMEGIRQSASIWFESILFGRVLMDWKYQIEFDIATRELQRQEHFSKEEYESGAFEEEHEDFDDDEDEADFNFLTHRVATMLVWRIFSSSTVSLYARHDFKYYSDWLVPTTNSQRHDNLTLLRLYFKQKLFSSLSARLAYSLEKNNSNDPTQKYTNNIYAIGLQFSF